MSNLRPPMRLIPATDGSELRSGFVFLNIADPHVAWLVYRGEMVSAPQLHQLALSSWTARYLADFKTNALRAARLTRELRIEAVRQRWRPTAVSRLTGFYLFPDESTARRAMQKWDGRGFREEHLAEVGIHPDACISRHDAEWISQHLDSSTATDDWIRRYLAGEPLGADPLWELVVDGRAYIYGTALREAAYKVVKTTWPGSLALLELSRLGPELGSDLGITTAMVVGKPGERQVVYVINMVDAENPEFLSRAHAFKGPVNSADLQPDSELVKPDLESRSFSLD